jgi:hypothetical protein
MKYKTVIDVADYKVYVNVFDENDNWVCNIHFNKQHIESLGNRYNKDGMSEASSELDVTINQILCKVQDKLGLAKSLDISS